LVCVDVADEGGVVNTWLLGVIVPHIPCACNLFEYKQMSKIKKLENLKT
jgi:hypothetical protein